MFISLAKHHYNTTYLFTLKVYHKPIIFQISSLINHINTIIITKCCRTKQHQSDPNYPKTSQFLLFLLCASSSLTYMRNGQARYRHFNSGTQVEHSKFQRRDHGHVTRSKFFLNLNHISGTAKARVVKFCTQTDYIKRQPWDDKLLSNWCGQGDVSTHCEILRSNHIFRMSKPIGASNLVCRMILTSTSACVIEAFRVT